VFDLRHILYVLTWDHLYVQGRSGLTPEEGSLNRGYLDAENRLFYLSGKVPGLSALMNRYSAESAPFRNELLDRYFSPAWKAAFLALDAQFHEREAASDRERDSTRALAARPFQAAPVLRHGAPVPPDQRRFAVAVNDWCRRFLAAPEQTNPIAREQFQREASRQAAAISRSVGLVQSWGGILSAITAYDRPVIARGEDASAADLVISVDTAATVRVTEDQDSIRPAAAVKATVGSSSPIYAAAGRMQEGQWVVFSGRALEFDQWAAGGEPPSCRVEFKIVLTALRPAP
jgi:hypothetical protein